MVLTWSCSMDVRCTDVCRHVRYRISCGKSSCTICSLQNSLKDFLVFNDITKKKTLLILYNKILCFLIFFITVVQLS